MDPGHLDLVFVIGVGLVIWGLVSLFGGGLPNRRPHKRFKRLKPASQS